MGLIRNKNLDEYQLNHNKELLRNFGKRKLTVSDDEIESSFKNIAKRIQRITENYRNQGPILIYYLNIQLRNVFDEMCRCTKGSN